jgi:hypothetical protein
MGRGASNFNGRLPAWPSPWADEDRLAEACDIVDIEVQPFSVSRIEAKRWNPQIASRGLPRVRCSRRHVFRLTSMA